MLELKENSTTQRIKDIEWILSHIKTHFISDPNHIWICINKEENETLNKIIRGEEVG